MRASLGGKGGGGANSFQKFEKFRSSALGRAVGEVKNCHCRGKKKELAGFFVFVSFIGVEIE